MTDKVVLLTRAISGFGRAAAFVFDRNGSRVVVSGRRDEEGKTLAAQMLKVAEHALYVRADMRNGQDVRNLIEFTIDRFGRLDAAVNSAGCERLARAVLHRSCNRYVATFQTRALGVVLGVQHEVAEWRACGSSHIVNLSSATPLMAAGMPIKNGGGSAADSWAQTNEMDVVAFGSRANGMARGPNRRRAPYSSMPSEGPVSWDEAAGAILFAASDEASNITLQFLCVDGGK